MEDISAEEKQNYLRENILEKGYDTNKFIDFLKSKKGEEGADITNWTMTDLKIIVKEFTSQNNNEENIETETKEDNQFKQDTEQNTRTSLTSPSNESKSKSNSLSIEQQDEDFGIILPEFENCKVCETTELSKYENLEITINSYKKVDKGIFSKSYITFLIATNPINLNVYRRFSDFDWLRERLSIMYNTNILPPLSKKGKIVEERKIKRRMRDLEKFLNYLLKDPLIKNSQIFYDFLSIESEEEFNNKKTLYNKLRTPTEFKDFKSINGKTRVNVNCNKEVYLEYIRDISALNETALKKLEQNFFSLRNEMNIVINRLISFSPLFEKLIKISSKYYDDNTTIESYKQIKHLFESWANTLKEQNSFFFIDMKEYFTFLDGNYHHVRDLVQVVENHKSNYYKLSKSLIAKKIELFKRQETSNWQLDVADTNNLINFYNDRTIAYKKICSKETNNLIQIKAKYGYFLNRMISEYERLRHINAIENKEKVINLSKKQQHILSDYFQIMGEIIGVMDGCIVEKLKEEGNIKKVNHEIDINENDNNNQQQEKDKKEENNNDIEYDD